MAQPGQRVFVVDAAHPNGYWTTQGGPAGPKRPKRPPVKVPPRPVRPVRKTVVDPFSPLTDAQLNERASASVRSQLDPIIAQIRAGIEARSRFGQAAIGGLTNSLGGLLSSAGPQSQGIYDRARATEAQASSGLAAALGQFGTNLSGEQGAKLALQGAPAGLTADITGGTQQTATGAANANLASATAEQQMLNTQGAAAGAYGAKLPGIAALTGIQHSRDLESQLSGDLSKQLADIESQAPGLISSVLQHLRDNEIQKGAYKQSGLFKDKQLEADLAYKSATLNYKAANDRRNRKVKLASLGISQQRVNETMRHNGISESQAESRLIREAGVAAETRRKNKVSEAQRRRAQVERERHNRQTEKNKKGGKAPWQK